MNEKKERIILDVAYQPQVRTEVNTQRIMLDVLIALLPAVCVAVYQFGFHALLVMATSVTSAAVSTTAVPTTAVTAAETSAAA